METHASFCSISVFVRATTCTFSIPHVSTFCNRNVLSYFILAIRVFRRPKQCSLLMVFQKFISKFFIAQLELFDCNYDWNACCP